MPFHVAIAPRDAAESCVSKPNLPGASARKIEPRSRIEWVDTAKGICIVLVVLLHSTHGVESARATVSWLHPFIEFARPFRMPDFFLLSGLFVARALQRDRGAYFDTKVTHFVYFFVLWTLVQVGLKESAMIATEGAGTFARHLAERLFFSPIGVMWFLYILATFFVTAWAFRRRPGLLLLLAVPMHLWDDEIVAALEPVVGPAGGLLWEYCSRLVFFTIGWIAAPSIFRLAAWARASSRAALAALAVWAVIDAVLVSLELHFINWIGLVLGLAGAAAVVLLSSLLAATSVGALLRAAGRRSLTIFASFFLGMAATRTVLLKLFPQADTGLIALGVFAAALATPFVLAWLIERSGHGRFLVERPSWARRRSGPPPPAPILQPATN